MAKMGRAYKYPKWARNEAKKNNIPMSVVRTRIFRGMSLEDSVKKPIRPRKKYPKWVYKQLEEKGISQNLFFHRIKKGMSVEEAINTPVKDKVDKKGNGSFYWLLVTNDEYELPIVVCDTARELAEYLGLKPNTVYSHLCPSKQFNVLGGVGKLKKVKKIDC